MKDWDVKRPLRKRHGFSDFFNDDFFFPSVINEPFKGLHDARQPLIDVVDKPKVIEVLAELPGVEKQDIKINVEPFAVALGAQQKYHLNEEDKKKGFFHEERSYQSFFRRIPLKAEIFPEKSRAEFKNGILSLVLEKKSPTEPKEKGFKVEVK